MTRRRREHPPRIDRQIGTVPWTAAMQSERVTLLVKAALHKSGHLRAKSSQSILPSALSNERREKFNPDAFANSARNLAKEVYRHACDADTADAFEAKIEESATGIHVRVLYKIVSRHMPVLMETDANEIRREQETYPLVTPSHLATSWLLKAIEYNLCAHDAIYNAHRNGDIDSDDINSALTTRFDSRSVPDDILRLMRTTDKGSVAYFVACWLSEFPFEQRMSWHVDAAADIALRGSISGLKLIASVFPAYVPLDVVPQEARLDIDALFAVHRFPFATIGSLIAKDRPHAALDMVFERLNDLLLDGSFEKVDAILASVTLDDHMHPFVAIGYLTMTFPAHKQLANFAPLVERTRGWLMPLYGSERTNGLLKFPGVDQ